MFRYDIGKKYDTVTFLFIFVLGKPKFASNVHIVNLPIYDMQPKLDEETHFLNASTRTNNNS